MRAEMPYGIVRLIDRRQPAIFTALPPTAFLLRKNSAGLFDEGKSDDDKEESRRNTCVFQGSMTQSALICAVEKRVCPCQAKVYYSIIIGPPAPGVNIAPAHFCFPQERGAARPPPAGSMRFAHGFRLRRKGLRPVFPLPLTVPRPFSHKFHPRPLAFHRRNGYNMLSTMERPPQSMNLPSLFPNRFGQRQELFFRRSI